MPYDNMRPLKHGEELLMSNILVKNSVHMHLLHLKHPPTSYIVFSTLLIIVALIVRDTVGKGTTQLGPAS